MRKLISLLLALLMIFSFSSALLSCTTSDDPGVNTGDNGQDDPDGTARRLVLAEGGASDYKIVYPAGFTNKEKYLTTELQSVIKSAAGAELEIVTDETSSSKYEILIGNTNRPESAAAKEMIKDGEYIITVINQKVVILSSDEKHYDYVSSYFKYGLASGETVAVYDDLKYIGGDVTTFVADEKVGDKTIADITLTPYSNGCKVGMFVGKEASDTLFGYKGYCILIEKTAVNFYEMGKTLELMGSKKINTVKSGQPIGMRLRINPRNIAAFLLDDAEGVEPWPELELQTSGRTTGMSVGFVELSGRGALYSDFSINESDAKSSGQKYTNAVYADYADPDVYYEDGTYYLYGTGGSGGFHVHTSTDLVNWKDMGVCAANNLWGVTNNYWAPDVECINGKYYMVVSCNECIGIAVADSPRGPFKENSKDLLYKRAIDGHIFVDDDGKIYLYFVYFNNYGIYGVELNSDLKSVKANTLKRIVYPELEWERYTMDEQPTGGVTEGPYMLKHNGTYYLTYSGSDYRSINYAVGYATSDSPLGNYKKYDLNPIMIGNSQVHGTAHHCIVTTEGGEMFIVYHCHNSIDKVQVRKICIDRIRFAPVGKGIDKLEVYGPTVTTQPYPDTK